MRRFVISAVLSVLLLLASGCGGDAPPAAEHSIVYVSQDGLYYLQSGTREPVRLADSTIIFSPRFSPDGAYITYNNSSDLFMYDCAAGRHMLAYPNARALYWDELGRLFALSANDGIVVIPPGEKAFVYQHPPDSGTLSCPVYPSDANGLAYALQSTLAGRTINHGLRIINSQLGNDARNDLRPLRLASDAWISTPIPLAYSSDGGILAINYKPMRSDKSNMLYFYNIKTGQTRTLRTRPYGLSGDSVPSISVGDYGYIPVLDKTTDTTETLMLINYKTMTYRLLPTNAYGVDNLSAIDETAVCYSSGGSIFIYRANTNRTLLICSGDYTEQTGDDGEIISSAGTYYTIPRLTPDGAGVYVLGITGDTGRLYTARTTTEGTQPIDNISISPPDTRYGAIWADQFDILMQ